MSYIQSELENGYEKNEITEFLEKEGFKEGTGASGQASLYYVASGNYTVWFDFCEDHLSLYAEYDCGGEVGGCKMKFDQNDFEDFMETYKRAVAWAKEYM